MRERAPGRPRELTTYQYPMRRAAAGALACVVAGLVPATSGQATPNPAPQHVPTAGTVNEAREHVDDMREIHLERASRARTSPRSAPAPTTTPGPVTPGSPPPRSRVTPRQRRPAQSPPPAPAAGSVAAVVAFALAQVGDPYVFGAEGPGVWDCSGLVAAAYARAGVRLPHSTGGILGHGHPVGRDQLEPGDVIFPTFGHVAIYLGGGRMVEAANPRAGVRVAAVWGFATARRIL